GADQQTVAMSVPWSAPEVLDEATMGTVHSEIWSLGATIYSLFAGRTPFEKPGKGQNTRENLSARIAQAKYTPIGRDDVPQRLEEVLAKSMSRRPDQRQQSAAQLAFELQRIQQELGLTVTALELGEGQWNSSTARVELGDEQRRGPVRPEVEVGSARKRRTSNHVTARSDEQII